MNNLHAVEFCIILISESAAYSKLILSRITIMYTYTDTNAMLWFSKLYL